MSAVSRTPKAIGVHAFHAFHLLLAIVPHAFSSFCDCPVYVLHTPVFFHAAISSVHLPAFHCCSTCAFHPFYIPESSRTLRLSLNLHNLNFHGLELLLPCCRYLVMRFFTFLMICFFVGFFLGGAGALSITIGGGGREGVK